MRKKEPRHFIDGNSLGFTPEDVENLVDLGVLVPLPNRKKRWWIFAVLAFAVIGILLSALLLLHPSNGEGSLMTIISDLSLQQFLPPMGVLALTVISRTLSAFSGYWIRESGNFLAKLISTIALFFVLGAVGLSFWQESWQASVGLIIGTFVGSNILFLILSRNLGTDSMAIWIISTLLQLPVLYLLARLTVGEYFPIYWENFAPM